MGVGRLTGGCVAVGWGGDRVLESRWVMKLGRRERRGRICRRGICFDRCRWIWYEVLHVGWEEGELGMADRGDKEQTDYLCVWQGREVGAFLHRVSASQV